MNWKVIVGISLLVVVSVSAGLYYGVPAAANSTGQNAFTLTLVLASLESPNSTLSGQYVFFQQENGVLESSAVINAPLGRLVRIVIINHDPGTDSLLTPSANSVTGTLNDQMQLFEGTSVPSADITSGTGSSVCSQLGGSDISHTFTTSTGLNIPIAPNSTEVTYTYFNTPGTISWGCMCECGQFSMSTPGWMMGEIVVAPSY